MSRENVPPSSPLTTLLTGLSELASLNSRPTTPQDKCKLDHYAEKVFRTLFKIGQSHYRFTDDDQKTLGPLMETALPQLIHKIHSEIIGFLTPSFVTICTIRSGLQYLLDDYTQFPTSTGNLEASLKRMMSGVDMLEYDYNLKHYELEPYDFYDDKEISHEIQLAPRSHWWWRMFTLTSSSDDDESM